LRPIRTALFAPGSKERVMSKAFESGADAVIFDLEDSVPISGSPWGQVLFFASYVFTSHTWDQKARPDPIASGQIRKSLRER